MSLELEDQYDKIYRYCYFKVNDAHLAEDLTQETFLHFLKQHTYVSQGKSLAYLYTIARNLCIDSYRRRKEISVEEYALENPSGEASSTALADRDRTSDLETQLACGQALRTLPQDQQELLLLRYANDLGYAQICAVTGLSRFSARRRINAALSSLRNLLREEDFT